MATSKMNQEFQERIRNGIDQEKIEHSRRVRESMIRNSLRHKYSIRKKDLDVENQERGDLTDGR